MASKGWQSLPFSEAVSVNPSVPMQRGKVYPFVDMQSVDSNSRSVYAVQNREFTGGGSRFKAGDTLMARITPCLENGKIARFAADSDSAIGHGSTEFIVIRGRPGISDTDFAFYLTKWDEVHSFAVSQMTGTSGRQRVPTESLGHLEIRLPPLPEQQAIAHILGTLDDKIELNRRMNETLEAMARAIFKSWFVDFDPVRAKAERKKPAGMSKEIADLFPDSFQDSELGEIPKGWRVNSLGDICHTAIGGDWGEEQFFPDSVEVICLRGVDLEHLRKSGFALAPRRWVKQSSLSFRRLDECDVLVAGSGAGPTGRPLWIADEIQSIYENPIIYSNFCKRFRCPTVSMAIYLDRWLYIMRESGEIWEYVNGTSVPNLDAKALLRGKNIPVPPQPILDLFGNHIRPIVNRLYSRESHNLTTFRDVLLPKLISGEIRLKNTEKLLTGV